MKKAILILVFIAVSAGTSFSETVLLCISDNQQQPEPTPWTVTVLRAFEDGVMDVFFEAGYIVTNSFLNECKSIAGEGVLSGSETAAIMADRMGADSVLMLKINFAAPVPDVLPVPVGAEYAMYKNSGRTLVEESKESFDLAVERGEEELVNSFTEIGRNIASGTAYIIQ